MLRLAHAEDGTVRVPDQAPGPPATKYRDSQQNVIASSPPLRMGQNPWGAWAMM